MMINKQYRLVHRVVWEMAHGPIPERMVVMHSCDNPCCVNLQHLSLGTPSDNTQDMLAKGRNAPPRGEKSGKSKLTEQDVLSIRSEAAAGVLQVELARKHQISKKQVSLIVNKKQWKHI